MSSARSLCWVVLLLALLTFSAALFALVSQAAHAATERYDYDPIGRLIRYVDANGQVTEYDYDPVGNITRVRQAGNITALLPTVTTATPSSFRKGTTAAVVVTGTNFTGARLTSQDPDISLSAVNMTPTQVSFTASAAPNAVPGPKTFNLTNAAGSANFNITLAPTLPVANFSPQPIAIPPDNSPRSVSLVLSNTDTLPHTLNLSSDNAAIATVSPASVSLAAGQSSVIVQITGKAGGLTTLRANSATLANASAPVFVTAEFSGVQTSYAPVVGVVVERPPVQNTLTLNGLSSPLVGVAVGNFYNALAPKAAIRGQTTTFTFSGAGLQGVSGATVTPSSGITVTSVTPAVDGKTVSVQVAVSANADLTQRRIALSGSNAPYRAAVPGADTFWVASGLPEIDSVEPFQVAPGTNGISFVVRGRHLHNAERILIPSSSGVFISPVFSVNDAGTVLTGGMEVPLSAVPGTYVVQVATAAGVSSATPAPANSFQVVNEISNIFTPITSALVGVVNGTPPTNNSLTGPLFSQLVGISVGSAVHNATPRAGIIGTQVNLTLSGNELGSVNAVTLTPSTGITVGSPTPAGDGKTVTVPLTIAADAPRTLRRLQVMAGTTVLPFSNVEASTFLVTAPQPEIESITPLILKIGDPVVSFIVRGKNLQGTTAIRFEPSNGMVVGATPTVNSLGTEASVSVSVQSGTAAGTRVVVVDMPAGSSSNIAGVANTVTLADNISATYSGVTSALVGVQNGPNTPPVANTLITTVTSPLIGVVVEQTPAPVSTTYGLFSSPVGVAVGPVLTKVEQSDLIIGGTGSLTLRGHGLQFVTNVQLAPNSNITVSSFNANVDGTVLTVNLTVDATAQAGARSLRLSTGTTPLPVAHAVEPIFYVAAAAPRIDSITPILASQGEEVWILIRGAHFQNARVVTVTPAAGVSVISTPVVNGTGTEMTVSLRLASNAALGARVLQVQTPGGTTTSTAVPANTFTVYPP
jgi:YD repeat-containing protein